MTRIARPIATGKRAPCESTLIHDLTRQRNVLDTGLARGVHHVDQQPVLGLLVGLDDDGTLRVLGVQPLDRGADAASVLLFAVDPDLVVLADRDEDRRVVLPIRGRGFRTANVDSGFLDEALTRLWYCLRQMDV